MYKNTACTLNGKHTYRDYGLYVTNISPVSPPEVRREVITIPGRNGEIDLTEALTGYPIYGNREITLELGGKKRPEEWWGFMSRFLNEIHGRRVRVIFDDEQNYYYVGRAVVESDYERGNWIGRFTVTISAEPYKYSVTGTDEKWLWDPFSFVDGVVREYAEIPVKGTLDYTIVGSQMPVIPVFTASTDMTVQFEGETYNLKQGSNTIYDIVLKNQEYHLIFKGNGTVTISYKAGRL